MIPTKQSQEEQQAPFLLEHQLWLRHPVTVQFLKLLEAQHENVVSTIAERSMDVNISDSHIRHLGVQLKTLRTLGNLVNNSEQFVKKITSNKQS